MINPLNLKSHASFKITFISILVIFLTLSASYTLLTPSLEGPDEGTIYHWSRYPTNDIPLPHYVLRQPLYYYTINFLLNFIEHPLNPTFDHEANTNFSHGYATDGDPNRWIHTETEKFPFSGSPYAVHVLRISSIIFGVITIIFVYKITRLLFPNERYFALFVMAIASFVPKFIFMTSVLNADSLLWLLVTLSLYYLLKFVNDTSKIKFLIFIGFFSGLAFLTKQNSLILIPIILSSFTYLIYSKQINFKKFFTSTSIIASVSLIFGGAYLIYFLTGPSSPVPFQTLTSNQFTPTSEAIRSGLECISNPGFLFTRLFQMNFGWIGWHVFPPSILVQIIGLSLMLISLTGIVFGIKKKFFKQFNLQKNYLVVILSSVFFMILGIFYFMFNICAGDIRYAYPVISMFAILFSLGFYFYVYNKRFKIILIFPIIFLILSNVALITEMNESYVHGFQTNLESKYIPIIFNIYYEKNSLPISGDWNGNGIDTVGVYQPSSGTFFLKNSNDSQDTDIVFNYGPSGGVISIDENWNENYLLVHPGILNTNDVIPITGDWNGNGIDTVGVYQFNFGQFYLKNSHEGGDADIILNYFTLDDVLTFSGDWNGNGIDTLGLYYFQSSTFKLNNSN